MPPILHLQSNHAEGYYGTPTALLVLRRLRKSLMRILPKCLSISLLLWLEQLLMSCCYVYDFWFFLDQEEFF